MIYSIVKKEESYFVGAHGEVTKVTEAFLKEKLQDYKFEELQKSSKITARATWDLTEFKVVGTKLPSLDDNPVSQTVKERKTFEKQYYDGKEYMLDKSSCYSGVYELHYLCKFGYYRFAMYVFDINSVRALITEHRLWLSYEKKLKRETYLQDLKKPEEEIQDET